MLSGHLPYWNPERVKSHPDELLRARLEYADPTKSLIEQDLVTLADGLEGRSTNPISLLVRSITIEFCADKLCQLYNFARFIYSWTAYKIRVLIWAWTCHQC